MSNMNWRNSLIAFVLVWSATACVNAEQGEKIGKVGYSIEVNTNLEDSSLVILNKITDTELVTLDSAYVNNGKLKFAGAALSESSIYYITFGTTQPPGIPIILEAGAKVEADITKDNSWYDVSMSGGKHNASMNKLYQIYSGFEKKLTEFNAQVSTLDPTTVTPEMKSTLTQQYSGLIQQRVAAIRNFIETEKASPATYFAVMYVFPEPNPELVILATNKMEKEMPTSSYTANLANIKRKFGPTVAGSIAPDIELKTPEGELLKLSSLRGKVVLIDFWASWCGPCRRENPNVKRIYDKYKDRGFEIYGVSLDNNAQRWKAAIEKDGLTWSHVSDLKGWQSSAAALYGVHSIPATFLIDQEGRIIKSNFRSHQLEALLEQALAE